MKLNAPIKIFYLEYLLTIYQVFQGLIQHDHQVGNIERDIIFIVFEILVIIKFKIEGLRLNILLIIINELILINNSYKLTVHLPETIIFSLLVLQTAIIYRSKVYQLPNPSGDFAVGFRHIDNFSENINISLYYPCVKTKWLNYPKYWNKLFDTSDKDRERPGKVPKIFFLLQSHYLYKMEMGTFHDADIIDIEDLFYYSQVIDKKKKLNQFPLIILSPGLAVHRTGYSLLAKELASKGFIVMSIEHEEEIKNPTLDRVYNRQFRKDQLDIRVQTMIRHLDFICDHKGIQKIFQKDIPVDIENISAIGHSFGGSTSIYTSFYEKRIKGVVVALDPCFFVFEDKYTCDNISKKELENKNKNNSNHIDFDVPLLCINTNFYEKLYSYFENRKRTERFFDCCIKNRKKNVLMFVNGQAHANSLDKAFFMSGDFSLFGVIEKGECPKMHMMYNTKLIEAFIENFTIFQNEQLSRELLLEKYFNFIGEQNKKKFEIVSFY